MKKEKLYNPDKCNSFKMQFGFDRQTNYMPNNRRKKPINHENKTNINRLLQSN